MTKSFNITEVVLVEFFFNFETRIGSESGKIAKFLSESNTFHIKSKAIKMLSCKKFATLLGSPMRILSSSLIYFMSMGKGCHIFFIGRKSSQYQADCIKFLHAKEIT